MTPRTDIRHASVVVAAFCILFGWVYAAPFIEGSFLAESDMYEQFLPQFLAPITMWSSFEFGGVPAFADPQDTAFYPLHFLFARIIGSWTAYIVAAYVLASCFTYAYVYSLTRSRAAAAFAGVAFGLSEAMMERIAHVTTIHAVAWLPAMLLVIDRLRSEQRVSLWIAIGGFVIASCLLGGHSQVVLYMLYACGLYALVGGLVERAGWTYYARLLAAGGLGLALAAVKTVPLVETMALTARQSTNFEAFVSHSNTPAQMLTIVLPAIVHEGREAPTYVGLATLICALTAALRPFVSWRTAFWLVVTIVALLIGAGDATPAAGLVYELPFYDRFRVGSRHLILAAFGIATLAGFGLAAIRRGDVSRRTLGAAIGLLAAALVCAVGAITYWPRSFEFDDAPALPWQPPVWNDAIWLQLGIGVASAFACIGLARRPRSAVRIAVLLGLLMADLLAALPYDLEPTGVDATRIPGHAIRPSVHAARLSTAIAPGRQRVLAPAGTQLDAVVPAAFARVWRIPIAGGYGPMLLARHSTLAMMGTNGSVDPLVLAEDNTALDLLAVKYVVMREQDLAASETTVHDSITWASRSMELPIGPAECGQRHPRTVSYALPPDVEVAEIALVAHLRCSEDVPQAMEVARLQVIGLGGETYERPLAAGIDVADAGLADAQLLRRAKHGPARIFNPESSAFSYLVRAALPVPIRASRIAFEVKTAGWLEISRLTLIDRSGRGVPVEFPRLLLERNRWRETTSFATSRITDRGADEKDAREERFTVFENRRALPRAWVVREVLPLSDKEMLTAVHHSQLPDGRHFEAARMALVSTGDMRGTSYPEGPSAAHVRAVRDGAFTVDVSTAGGGFLVLSESFYPGWRARIGDGMLPVYATDVSLQGVPVPPGRHTVEFELISTSLRAGAAVSSLGVVIALVSLGLSRRQPASKRPHHTM